MTGGLSVIHPGFVLAGLLAAAVPVVIHLWLRPRPRRVEIGSVRLLKVAMRQHARRRNVRRWLLLSARVAGVLLLGLLFARPYLRGAPAGGRDREVALVIDRSASLRASAGGTTAFARAQGAAEALLAALPEQTAVHLAYADADGVEPAPEPRVDRRLRCGFAASDHGKALAWARDLLVVSRRRDRRAVYVTDLQRSGLGRAPAGGWPEGVTVEVIDVGRPVPKNLAVIDARVDRQEIRPGEPVVVSAVVTNTGALPLVKVPVRLALEGPSAPRAADQAVSLGPGASEVVRFPIDGPGPGAYRGAVAAEPGDDFPEDDRRWLAFEARPAERVLLVDGEPGPTVFGQETYYLETAMRLKPPGQGASATPYETVRVARGGGAALPPLRGFGVVVACNVGDWTEGEASSLREYVASGGRFVLFSGRKVTPETGDRLRRARLVPAEVLGTSEPGAYRFGTWARDHPVFRALSDPQHGDLRRLESRRITRWKPDAEAVVLARTPDGEPIVFEAAVGSGRLLVFALAADRDWGDWPVHRLFLPMVHQVLGDLTGRLSERRTTEALNAGPKEPPGVSASGRVVTVRNLDPKESETERVRLEVFRRAYRLPDPKPEATEATGAVAGAQRPDEVWRYLIWGLFVVLVAETFLANRTHA